MHRNTFILILGLGIVLIGAVSLLSTLASHSVEWSLVVLCILAVSLATNSRPHWGRRAAPPARAQTPGRIGQTWSGTLRIWPEHPEADLQIYPVRMGLALRSRQAHLLTGATPGGDGVVDVTLAGYDAAHRDLDLAVTVQRGADLEKFPIPLRYAAGRLRTIDDGLPLSLELRKEKPRRRKNRRARARRRF